MKLNISGTNYTADINDLNDSVSDLKNKVVELVPSLKDSTIMIFHNKSKVKDETAKLSELKITNDSTVYIMGISKNKTKAQDKSSEETKHIEPSDHQKDRPKEGTGFNQNNGFPGEDFVASMLKNPAIIDSIINMGFKDHSDAQKEMLKKSMAELANNPELVQNIIKMGGFPGMPGMQNMNGFPGMSGVQQNMSGFPGMGMPGSPNQNNANDVNNKNMGGMPGMGFPPMYGMPPSPYQNNNPNPYYPGYYGNPYYPYPPPPVSPGNMHPMYPPYGAPNMPQYGYSPSNTDHIKKKCEEETRKLVDMGFNENDARDALERFNGDINAAISYLVSKKN